MKLNAILFVLSLFVASLWLPTAHAGTTLPNQPQQNISQTVVLDMQNMTCAMCKFTIKKALQGVDGVAEANVDYDTKTARLLLIHKKPARII
jgi:periplasmic mercuric ion binding protein